MAKCTILSRKKTPPVLQVSVRHLQFMSKLTWNLIKFNTTVRKKLCLENVKYVNSKDGSIKS